MCLLILSSISVVEDPTQTSHSMSTSVTFALNLIDKLSGEDQFSISEIVVDYTAHWRNLKKASRKHVKLHPQPFVTESSIQLILQDENRKLNEALADVQNNQGGMTQGEFMQVLQTEAAKLQKNLARRA